MSYVKKSVGNGVVKEHEEYTTGRGVHLQIYAVPQPIIRSISPNKPRPELPLVEMKVAGGATQKRPAKETDAAWIKYHTELATWEEERDALQEAVTFCFALKTFKFPDDLSLSPELQQLVELGMLKVPDNPFVAKFMWLRENVLGQHDEYNINMLIQKLSGVPEDIIDEMKRNFRNILLGTTARSVVEQTKAESKEPEEDVQEQ